MAFSATLESISEEVVVMLVSLLLAGRRVTSGSRLNQSQGGQASIKLWRKQRHSAGVLIPGARRVSILEIAPALVRTAGPRHNADQLRRADDVDPAVLAVLEPKDLLARDQPVLDDPVEIAADQL